MEIIICRYFSILRFFFFFLRGDLIEATRELSRDTIQQGIRWQTISQTMHRKRKWYEGYDIESIGGKRAISASKCHVAIKLLSIKPSSWNILASAFTASQSYSLLSCHHSQTYTFDIANIVLIRKWTRMTRTISSESLPNSSLIWSPSLSKFCKLVFIIGYWEMSNLT